MSLPTSPRATKYAQLAESLRDQISRSVMLPGDRLPSLGELSARYEASLGTVDKALRMLEKDELIVRVNGSGIFVATPASNQESSPDRPLLGLVVPICHGPFFSPIIEAVQAESRAAGFHLLLASSLDDLALEGQLLRQLSSQTQGLCIVPCGPGNQAAFASLLERRTPFVLLDRRVEGLSVSLVATDNERGGYLATRHLIEAGCQRIYTVGETSTRISSLRERVAGFRRALNEAGIPFHSSLIRQADGNPDQSGYFLTRDLLSETAGLKLEDGKIGIFALNEHISPGCYVAIKERGLKIPGDIALVGFDDATGPIFDPPLTAVRQDLAGMGREGVRRLLEVVRHGSAAKPRTIRLQPELIVRNSSDANSPFSNLRLMQGNAVSRELVAKSPVPLG